MRAPRVRAFNVPVDYTVPGLIAVLRQDKSMACWAFSSLMLEQWRRAQSLNLMDFLDALDTRAGGGTMFRDAYVNNTGLMPPQAQRLLAAMGLHQEPAASFTVSRWEQMLRECGPLLVIGDEALTPAFAVHARLMCGITGDGTPDGTTVDVVDPGTGTRFREPLSRFLAKYEQLAPTTWAGVQIVHFAAGTTPGSGSMSVSRSLSARTTAAHRPHRTHRLASALTVLPPPPPPALDAWVPLIRFKPPASVLSALDRFTPDARLHRIENANGALNLDWYPVRATLPAGVTPNSVVDRWRRDVNSTVDQRLAYFEPYDSGEAATWSSPSPTGAVIHIDMRSGADWANPDDGSVVVGESAADHWIFSTIWTAGDGDHPVSGNRWFGFVPGEGGDYIFGTRGADRATGLIDYALSEIIFTSAHSLWLTLQQGLARLIDGMGGSSHILPATSARYDWPGVTASYHVP